MTDYEREWVHQQLSNSRRSHRAAERRADVAARSVMRAQLHYEKLKEAQRLAHMDFCTAYDAFNRMPLKGATS